MSYFVFVDNSNVWIEGKVASAVAKGFALNTSGELIGEADQYIDLTTRLTELTY